ncbi:MAG: hypothetical protein Q8N23_04885 [Archangium sp.]|nr:hypothetical protein [Archangium sp.]MDP3151980.1 hypothetical protein [Archangium sp.]MDP3571393.1 hypothetical protein [Archangium sp.]
MKWRPRGEWRPAMPSEATPLSPTLRPSVPTWTTRVTQLPPEPTLKAELRRSSLAWKEVRLSTPREAVRNALEE